MGAIYAVATLIFKADQGISGIGIFLFGLGFSELLFLEQVGTPRSIPSFRRTKIPLLGDIPHWRYLVQPHSDCLFSVRTSSLDCMGDAQNYFWTKFKSGRRNAFSC